MNDEIRSLAMNPRVMQAGLALLIGGVVIGFMAIRGCQSGPFGRKQIVYLTPEQENTLGGQAFQEVMSEAASKNQVVTDARIVRPIKAVTDRLIAATRNSEFLKATKLKERKYNWQVEVIRSKQINAFCLPGGKMVVYTGILPVCETDAGLATVMGHEISHALGRHGAERMAQAQMAQIGVSAAGAGMGSVDPAQRQRMMQILNAGAQFGIMSYGRRHESEADHMGLLLMATAGYNPEEAVKFWVRMGKATGGSKTPEFLSTHPSHETRIRDLQKWMPEALKLYQASGHKDRPRKLEVP